MRAPGLPRAWLWCGDNKKAGDKPRPELLGENSNRGDARVVALGDITVSGVATLAAHGNVVGFDLGDLIVREGFGASHLHVQTIEVRAV